MEDITVNNVIFADRNLGSRLKGADVFADLTKAVTNPKKLKKIEEVSLETFLADIVPTAQKIEVLLENRFEPNMVSLIAPKELESPSMFKWRSGFSWAYVGNITDSMKQRVKALGGNVDGVLRFSIQWNDSGDNLDDLDAHCKEPKGDEIYFGNKRGHKSSGSLDVDIIHPDGVAVENIVYTDLSKMPEGTYKFFVHCYNSRSAMSGFTAEIEFGGQIYSFAYNQPLGQDQEVVVALVSYDKRTGMFTLTEKIPSQLASRKAWDLDTNQFHPVSIMMYSPNYWDGECAGNRHVFLMLDGCKNPECPNGFFNEFLKNELLEHRKVFEALGGKMRVESSDDQLSGVGFSTTQRNEFTVKITGQTERILKVKI